MALGFSTFASTPVFNERSFGKDYGSNDSGKMDEEEGSSWMGGTSVLGVTMFALQWIKGAMKDLLLIKYVAFL